MVPTIWKISRAAITTAKCYDEYDVVYNDIYSNLASTCFLFNQMQFNLFLFLKASIIFHVGKFYFRKSLKWNLLIWITIHAFQNKVD